MIAPLSTALSQARSHLNDDQALLWPDPKLIPKAQQAFNEMQAKLLLAGIPIMNAQTVVITIPALTTDDLNLDMSTVVGYPTDMILPIWMKERQVGDQFSDFVDMSECDFIPNVDKDIYLYYWAWIGQTIFLRGALVDTQVQLRYQRLLPLPQLNTDSTSVILCELFLAYRIASLCKFTIGDDKSGERLQNQALTNLDQIVRMSVKELQNLPAARQPYHRGNRYYGGFLGRY